MASTRVCTTFSMEILTKGAVLNEMVCSMPRGRMEASSAMRFCTAAAVRTALAPGDSCTAALVAGLPSSRLEKA